MTADELAARTGEKPGRIVRALSALERMGGDRLGVLAALPDDTAAAVLLEAMPHLNLETDPPSWDNGYSGPLA